MTVRDIMCFSPGIVAEYHAGKGLPQRAEIPVNGKPVLVRDYRVERLGDDAMIVLQGRSPYAGVDWPASDSAITPKMAALLDTNDAWVASYTHQLDMHGHTGLNALNLVCLDGSDAALFGHKLLVRTTNLTNHYTTGWLVGSQTDGDGRLQIPGIRYSVRPEVMRESGNFLEISRGIRNRGMVHASSRDVNAALRFTAPEKPEERWLASEVARFERAGEGLKEQQVAERYQELRSGLRRVRTAGLTPREILAFHVFRTGQVEMDAAEYLALVAAEARYFAVNEAEALRRANVPSSGNVVIDDARYTELKLTRAKIADQGTLSPMLVSAGYGEATQDMTRQLWREGRYDR